MHDEIQHLKVIRLYGSNGQLDLKGYSIWFKKKREKKKKCFSEKQKQLKRRKVFFWLKH